MAGENLGQTNLFTSSQLLWCGPWHRNRRRSGLRDLSDLTTVSASSWTRHTRCQCSWGRNGSIFLESINQREFIYYCVVYCLFPEGSLRRWWCIWWEFKMNLASSSLNSNLLNYFINWAEIHTTADIKFPHKIDSFVYELLASFYSWV